MLTLTADLLDKPYFVKIGILSAVIVDVKYTSGVSVGYVHSNLNGYALIDHS